MNKRIFVSAMFLVLLFLAVPAGSVMAGFSFGVSANDRGVDNFYVALSDYNRVPQQDVMAVKNRGIPDEELPVVYFMASKANVRPEVIANMRLKHMAWMDIALKFHIKPDAFYVPVKGQVHGGPYESFYGHYNVKKSRWNKIRLTDDEVVNSVNLRFASEHSGYAPEEIIKMRAQGKTFMDIHKDIKGSKDHKGGHDYKGNGYDRNDNDKNKHDHR